ncbi:hypothetical protein [Actinomadura madurae]|uniref:hypothetical protein n=1 Tax=Actinomadura madurae TaxID=1993 RepID=UPI0020D20EC3|nr:hypothetical protein [Actinomadura madurae]MCQ0014380.1 hypothetical protein [Actinomadura madurae]
MTGATDLAIITATLQLHDIDPTHDLVTEFARRSRCVRRLPRRHRARGHTLAGARAALHALAECPGRQRHRAPIRPHRQCSTDRSLQGLS